MSLKVLFLLLGASALIGGAIGFVFRWLLVLARKGSLEIRVKQMELDAREKAERIALDAEEAARIRVAAVEGELKEKEDKIARRRPRL